MTISRATTSGRLLAGACLAWAMGCGHPSPPGCEEDVPGPPATETPLPRPQDWRDVGVVLDTGPFGSWDAIMEGATPAAIVRHGGTYFLYYVGVDDYIADPRNIGPAHRAVGVATSSDGINWTKSQENPVLTWSSSGNPEEGAVSAGIFHDGERFVAYYGANTASSPTTARVTADIRLATSQDGVRFEDAGKIVDHADRSVWGSGDEIHPTLSLRHAGTTYVYYVPNGSLQQGRLGCCWGDDPASLRECAPVRGGDGPPRSRGPSSAVPVGPDVMAFFVCDRGTINAHLARTNCLIDLAASVESYHAGGNAIVTLDARGRTWLMYYDRWTHIGLKVAPAGALDETPPAPPPRLAGHSPRHDRVRLEWSAASDPETGVLSYDVLRDGRQVGSTRGLSLEDSLLTERTDYGYEVRAVNLHGVVGEAARCVVRTGVDSRPPALASVMATAAGEVRVTFDEPVAEEAARSAARYAIDGGAAVLASRSGEDPQTVVLTTTPMHDGALHVLSVAGISDRAVAANVGVGRTSFTASGVGGLLGFWSLDDPADLGRDWSGGGHHARVVGHPAGVDGKRGLGLRLMGREYLEIEPTPALTKATGGEFTFVAWVRPEGAPAGTDNTNAAYAIFSALDGLRLEYRFDRVFVAGWHDGTDRHELASASLPPDQWHHLALVGTPTSLALFVDGQAARDSPLTLPRGRSPVELQSPNHARHRGQVRIGVREPALALASNFFHGDLDEVRLYDRALTQTELQTLP